MTFWLAMPCFSPYYLSWPLCPEERLVTVGAELGNIGTRKWLGVQRTGIWQDVILRDF